MSTSSANAYECTTLLTPGPTEPVPTPRPATPVPSVDPAASPERRRAHPSRNRPSDSASRPRTWAGATSRPGTKVDYDYCPPASGSHYNIGGRGTARAPVLPTHHRARTRQLGPQPGAWLCRSCCTGASPRRDPAATAGHHGRGGTHRSLGGEVWLQQGHRRPVRRHGPGHRLRCRGLGPGSCCSRSSTRSSC